MSGTLLSHGYGFQPFRAAACAALALLVICPAWAGIHQICYRDLTIPNEPLAVSAQCRSDAPGVSCTINPPLRFTLLSTSSSSNSRSETYRAPSATATYHLSFQFSNGTARGCTVEMGVPHGSYAMPAQGSLVGFTTDASGLVMTGVWKRAWEVPVGGTGKWEYMEVPTDFVVTGGGAVGAETPNGAMLANLQQAGPDVWETGTMELLSSDSYVHEAHAIAMKIEGLTHADLKTATDSIDLGSATAAHPSVTNPVPAGWLVVGGGAWVHSGPPWRQFLTADAPVLRFHRCPWWAVGCRPGYVIDGWIGSSKDHVVSAPGSVTAEIDLMRPELLIGGVRFVVDVAVTAATSAVAQHPAVAVAGTPGEYALTGVGASVDWQSYGSAGNLLWKLIPRPDIAGSEAASKDHSYVSPATVTAYAIGVKLRSVPFD